MFQQKDKKLPVLKLERTASKFITTKEHLAVLEGAHRLSRC